MVDRYLATLLFLLLFTSYCVADDGTKIGEEIVWLQPPTLQDGFVDRQFPDFPDFSTYMVSDVPFAVPVVLQSVTTYFTDFGSGKWSGITGAVLNIFLDDGQLDSEDPSSGQVVPVTVADSDGDGILEMTVTDLNIKLLPGTYWIGLTPIASLAEFGNGLHLVSDFVENSPTYVRNPEGGLGFGSDWLPLNVAFGTSFADVAIQVVAQPIAPLTVFFVPVSFQVVRGIQIGGNVESLCSADDDYLVFNPGITLSSIEAPVWIEFETNVGSRNPYGVTIQSNANTSGLIKTVEVFNFATGQYELVGTSDESVNVDAAVFFSLPDTDDYKDFKNQVRLRVGWRIVGPALVFPWEIRINLVLWEA